MIYSLVRPIAALALKIYFRKIYFTHRDRIPKGKPVIIAINHPTAFIEPCICACFLPMGLYFLVRGDLFKKPIFRKMLNILHMVPIYRMQEGKDQLVKNDATFDFCYEALKDMKTVVILPEGRTIQEKRLRPIRKGLARIAFGTYEKHGDIDLHIVPIGVNFTQADKFRTIAMLDVGEPLRLRDYYDMHQENPQKAIRHLTGLVKEALENHIVNIPSKDDDDLVEDFFTIYRNEQQEKIYPIISENRQPLEAEMSIADGVTNMSSSEKNIWAMKLQQYFYKLKSNGLSDFGMQQPEMYNGRNTCLLVLGFIPYIFGYWLNYPIFGFAKYVSDTKVKQLEFKAPVALAVGLGLSILLILILLLLLIFWSWWAGVIFLGLFFMGRFSLVYDEFREKYRAAKAAKQTDDSTFKKLKDERNEISQKANEMALGMGDAIA